MKILIAFKYVFKNLRLAASLSPFVILGVIAAEGVQHAAEYWLGMYQSQAIFHDLENHPLRLGAGALKAIVMIAGCYLIAKALADHQGPPPKRGSFRADMIRRLWDPKLGITGLVIAISLAAPIIFLHYKLSYFAMGHEYAPLLLAVDSCLIGILAWVAGTAIWAGDKAEHERS